MSIKEAIILAGGLGTRLSAAVPDLPKSLAPVAGTPFLHYIMNYLQGQGISRYVLALGYKHEAIRKFMEEYFPDLDILYSVENIPLGTGGAIRLASRKLHDDRALVLNGDTFFKVDLEALLNFHLNRSAQCTLSLKPMEKIDRYGVVELNQMGAIVKFREKKFYKKGLINGGVYVLERRIFSEDIFPEQFSFEKDYLEKNVSQNKLFGFEQDKYFIDIGVPEDYRRAQTEFLQFSNS